MHDGELLMVAARSCSLAQKKRLFKNAPYLQTIDRVLEFSGQFEFPGRDKFFLTNHTGKKIKRTNDKSISDWKGLLPSSLELVIQTYLCALSIAYEGAVRPIGNVWIQNGSLACTRYRRHRVKVFDGAGGGLWRGGSTHESSSLKRFG